MVKIDNYKNVKKYLKSRSYDFIENVEVLHEENEYPQGLCMTEDYILISTYSDTPGNLGKIKVYDKDSGELLLTLLADSRSHMGGIAFDGNYIWVCNSSKMALERISYRLVQQMVREKQGKTIDIRNRVDIYRVNNIPSSVTYYDGQLWVATHSIWTNASMVAYTYNADRDELNATASYRVPSKVQGVTFTEQGEVYLSTSYGRKKSSYIKKYQSVYTMTEDTDNYTERIELPPCSEGLVYENGCLYVLFESAGKKYLEGTDGKGRSVAPLDKILKLQM